MADYIDREALIERLTRNLNACNPGTFSERCYQDAINTVTFFLAADVAPVVHGRWIPCENGGYYCSNCDRRVAFLIHNRYCPNCGAKMDGDGNG